MHAFLVNKENPHAESLCRKLASAKTGDFIELTTDEFNLHDSEDFQHINYSDNQNANIIEVKEGGTYIFVANKNTNIDDIVRTAENLKLNAGIIRES